MKTVLPVDNIATLPVMMVPLADARLSINDIHFDKGSRSCVLDLWIPSKPCPTSRWWPFGKPECQHWQLVVFNVDNLSIDDWDEPLEYVNRESKEYLLGEFKYAAPDKIETWSSEGLILKLEGKGLRCLLKQEAEN